MILKSTLEEINNFDALVFYSIHMLPIDRIIRYYLYKSILSKHKKLFFSLENMGIEKEEDLDIVEDLLLIKYIHDSKKR